MLLVVSPYYIHPADGTLSFAGLYELAAHTGPETEDAPGHLTEQIGAATGDLAQLRHRGVHAQRVPAPHAGQR